MNHAMRHYSVALMVLTVLSISCMGQKPTDDHGHGHEHDEEPKTAQITVWSDLYEVFAEYRAPVTGKATTFITHVTDLHTLEPRREGMVKFVMRQGDTVAEHPQNAPARAGIYLPGIIFPKPGDWQVTLLIPTGGTNAPVELGTIKVYEDQHAADHALIPNSPEAVSFLKEQQWKIRSMTEPVTNQRLVGRMRVSAGVRALPGCRVPIYAPVSGQLASAPGDEMPSLGQQVKEGQLLVILKPHFSEAGTKVAEAQAEFITARAALDQAEVSYQRTRKLAAEEAKSPREMQEAELAYQSAKARDSAAASLLATFKQTSAASSDDAPLSMEIRAPISGVLNEMTAGPGDVVSANQSLFTVVNTENVWIEAKIPQSRVSQLSEKMDAEVEFAELPGEFISITGHGRGRFVSLGMEVDSATQTLPLIYETANPNNQFRIGQRVVLHVETARMENTLAVPDSALLEEGNQLIAYVQISGETFEKRIIKAGVRDTGFVQVIDGIAEGERVVTKGAYAIRLSSISGIIPAHGHAH